MLTNRKCAIAAALAAAVAITTVSMTPAQARSRGDALMLGAIAGLFGTIATIAAAKAARDRYYDYDYYDRPAYGPVYAAPPVYVPRHHPHWGGHHHWHR
jgi:hypothetical protein